MTPNKIHVDMPLKIPQNIIDVLKKYKKWRENGIGCKDSILDEMARVGKRWHLYNGFEACVGTFIIYTKVGVVIKAVAVDKEPLKIDWFVGQAQFGSRAAEFANAPVKEYTNKRGTYVYHFTENKETCSV